MLNLVGTGLYYLDDIPLRALEIIRESDEVFLEHYTNLNDITFMEGLERATGKVINTVSRERVESNFLLERAAKFNICLLVPGDPLAATTHIALLSEAKRRRIPYNVIHASSIFTAVAETGLSLYRFGAATSIPVYTPDFKPESFFETIEKNLSVGLHTLVLLEAIDIATFVSVNDAVSLLKDIEKKRGKKILDWETVIVVSRIGSEFARIDRLKDIDGREKPPTSLVIPAELTPTEKENVETFWGPK